MAVGGVVVGGVSAADEQLTSSAIASRPPHRTFHRR
jgi:hypothetical protein